MMSARMGAAMLLLALVPVAAVGQESHQHGAEKESGQHMMGMQGDSMDHQMMGGEMMMESGMMVSMMMAGPGPGMILRQSETLGLDAIQIKQLEALQQEAMVGHESQMTKMKGLHDRLSQTLTTEDVNIEQYEALLRQMADERIAMHVRNLTLGQDALALLSEEQRGKLRSGHMMGRPMMGDDGMAGRKCEMAGGAADETS